MTEALEGTQVLIENASKPQLRRFATHLGIAVTNFDTEEKLIQKIREAGYGEPHIIATEDGPGPARSERPGKAAAVVVTEPMVELTIHTQEGPGGKRPVFVGVNGKGILIPRNKPVKVKLRYFEALKNAIETKYEFDEDAKANMPREMPSYPYQTHSQPSTKEIEDWHAFEAREEARLRPRDDRSARGNLDDEAA